MKQNIAVDVLLTALLWFPMQFLSLFGRSLFKPKDKGNQNDFGGLHHSCVYENYCHKKKLQVLSWCSFSTWVYDSSTCKSPNKRTQCHLLIVCARCCHGSRHRCAWVLDLMLDDARGGLILLAEIACVNVACLPLFLGLPARRSHPLPLQVNRLGQNMLAAVLKMIDMCYFIIFTENNTLE